MHHSAVAATTAAAAWPRSALAGDRRGGVQWNLDLPDGFEVQRQLASIVRVKLETMLAADDPSSGAQVKLLLLPFGQQAGASLTPDDQLELAKYFFAAPGSSEGTAEAIAKTMAQSASRSPGITSLKPAGTIDGYTAADGRRYVRYGYVADRCTGDVYDGECLGDVTRRRTLATVTMSSISQFRTNTERERMKELGQVRNVDVLWLLTLSAPDGAAWGRMEPVFERIAKSLSVPLQEA